MSGIAGTDGFEGGLAHFVFQHLVAGEAACLNIGEDALHFGLPVIEPRPALVPLKTPPALLPIVQALAGVAVDGVAKLGKVASREGILFTHRGFSGPAILQISSYWREGDAITLNLLPDWDAFAYLKERKTTRPRAELKTVLSEVLPQRLAHALSENQPHGPMAEMPDKVLRRMAEQTQALRSQKSVPRQDYSAAALSAGASFAAGASSATGSGAGALAASSAAAILSAFSLARS
jgi:predicted flavoprotein YhiN